MIETAAFDEVREGGFVVLFSRTADDVGASRSWTHVLDSSGSYGEKSVVSLFFLCERLMDFRYNL